MRVWETISRVVYDSGGKEGTSFFSSSLSLLSLFVMRLVDINLWNLSQRVYENEYILEDGIWKIFKLRYFPFWHAEFDKGWQKTKANYVPFFSQTYPEDPAGPDELVPRSMMWPDTRVIMIVLSILPFSLSGTHLVLLTCVDGSRLSRSIIPIR
jgi:hypothetical protein